MRRRIAARAWFLLFSYCVMLAALLAATRLGAPLSPLAGLAPRYVSDAVLVAALCVAVALLGRREDTIAPRPLPLPAILREPGAAAVGTMVAITMAVVLAVGAATSTSRFSDIWVRKTGRTYLLTAQADLAKAPPDTVFFDSAVPSNVVAGYFYPYNLQSRFFSPLAHPPAFVTEADSPSVFDATGHIRPATVAGYTTPRGSVECGYPLEHGQAVTLPLGNNLFQWDWIIRVNYLSQAATHAEVTMGGVGKTIPIRAGIGQYFFTASTGGGTVTVTPQDPSVGICLDSVTVGNIAPQPG